jgi:ABC-type multidrug transport system permease subunit
MTIIILGYLAGVLHKAFYAYDWVIFLYVLNMTMVSVDLVLYLRFARRREECEPPDAAR